MPTVPYSNNVVPGPGTQPAAPNPTMLAMAVALMHSEGKFGNPNADKGTSKPTPKA
jgi:hypothetical protein